MPIQKDSRAVQRTREAFGFEEDGDMKTFSLRLTEKDIIALKDHFRRKGLKLSQGLRMIIREYMEESGI